jgi:hypothetical protein
MIQSLFHIVYNIVSFRSAGPGPLPRGPALQWLLLLPCPTLVARVKSLPVKNVLWTLRSALQTHQKQFVFKGACPLGRVTRVRLVQLSAGRVRRWRRALACSAATPRAHAGAAMAAPASARAGAVLARSRAAMSLAGDPGPAGAWRLARGAERRAPTRNAAPTRTPSADEECAPLCQNKQTSCQNHIADRWYRFYSKRRALRGIFLAK